MGYFEHYTKNPKNAKLIEWMNYLYKRRWEAFKHGSLFLDVGFGAGFFYKNAPSGKKVICVDNDFAALKNLERIGGEGVIADASALPFKEGTFDGIHAAHIIEHLTNPLEFFAEAYRVLKPGGTLLVLTPDIKRYRFNFYLDFTHKTPFTKESLEKICRISGFKDIKVSHGLGRLPKEEMFVSFKSIFPIVYQLKCLFSPYYSGELFAIVTK